MSSPAADADLTTYIRTAMPFTEVLGLEILSSGPDGVVGRATWAAERCTSNGIMHGGYLMAVVDSVGAMCAVLNLPEGAGTSTIESKTNFLRAVTEGEVTLTSTPVHVGRTTIVVQTDVTRDGKLVTRTTQTQAVLAPR
jgi:uncharacterized protein (TIGR00369 family)